MRERSQASNFHSGTFIEMLFTRHALFRAATMILSMMHFFFLLLLLLRERERERLNEASNLRSLSLSLSLLIFRERSMTSERERERENREENNLIDETEREKFFLGSLMSV